MTMTIIEELVNIHGKQLNVRQLIQNSVNDKPTLVFLHEGLGCIELWKDFPILLAEATGLNALIYERQGYGQSAALDLPRPLDYLEQEAAIYLPCLLEHYHLQNPILVGHSDGGTIALIYAANYPVTMVLAAAAHVLVEDITIRGIQDVVAQYKKNKFANKLEQYHGKKADDLFWAWADTWLNPSFRAWNITYLLPQITCPVLLLQGKKDEYATDKHLHLIVKEIGSSASGILLEDCGHSPHIQSKGLMLNYFVKFIHSTENQTL